VSFVLDASAALAWAFERVHPDEAKAALTLLARFRDDEALVPDLWHLEVANALVVGNRRGAISAAKVSDFLARLDALPIRTDATPASERKERLFALAREHELSAYDAAYLDLAMRTGSPLATFDRRLAGARDRAGVPEA
jgi:predicted nucleic acid-binding protein